MVCARRSVSFVFVLVTTFCAASSACRADLVSLNDPSLPASADGFNITLDTATGLEWLDVNVSAAYTFQTIQGQFAPGGLFPGFRYATDQEFYGDNLNGINYGQVHSLTESAGLGEGTTFSVVGYGLVRNLMGFVGLSGNPAYGYAYGTVLDSLDPTIPLDAKIEASISQGFNFGETRVGYYGTIGPHAINTTDVGLPVVRGNWLVRAHAVPEPSGALMAGVDVVLVGLARWARSGAGRVPESL